MTPLVCGDRRTSRPAAALPLSGPRGLRRDLVDVLRALLPDPQLHRGLGQRELQFLDFGPLPALEEVPAALTKRTYVRIIGEMTEIAIPLANGSTVWGNHDG